MPEGFMHASVHLKVGILERIKGGMEGRIEMVVVINTVHTHNCSSEHDCGMKSGCNPHITDWNLRGAEAVSWKRHVPFCLPITADPERGSWEALNSTVVPKSLK